MTFAHAPRMSPRALQRTLLSFPILAMLGFGATGCTLFDLFESEPTLSDLALSRARVEVELDADPMVHLSLEAKDGTCQAITDAVEAKVDDRSMDLFMRGGEQPTKDGWVCGAPTFRKALATADLGANSTRFEVSDDTAKIRAEFDGLLVTRTIALAAPNETIEAGKDIEVAWSAASDVLTADDLAIDFAYDDQDLELPVPATVRLVDGAPVVRIPQGAPPGAGTITVFASIAVPSVVCEGAPSCEAVVHVSPSLEVEVVGSDTPP